MGEFQSMMVRLGFVLVLVCLLSGLDRGQQRLSVDELLEQFKTTRVFSRQFEVAKALAAANDPSVLPKLESWLTEPDRHLRGNAAFVFARLGDARGFDVIFGILGDRSEGREVWEFSSAGGPSIRGQIRQDRYYAAHLLGDLKDPRAVPILVPLLKDPDVNFIVPWSLGQIGDRSAISPLIETLNDPDPSMRVLAIYALAELKASEALPRLRQLLSDQQRSNFDKGETVSEAAQKAIAELPSETGR